MQWTDGNENTEVEWQEREKARESAMCVFVLTSGEELTDLAQGFVQDCVQRGLQTRSGTQQIPPTHPLPLNLDGTAWCVHSRPGRLKKSCRGSTTLRNTVKAEGKENREDAQSVQINVETDASQSTAEH